MAADPGPPGPNFTPGPSGLASLFVVAWSWRDGLHPLGELAGGLRLWSAYSGLAQFGVRREACSGHALPCAVTVADVLNHHRALLEALSCSTLACALACGMVELREQKSSCASNNDDGVCGCQFPS